MSRTTWATGLRVLGLTLIALAIVALPAAADDDEHRVVKVHKKVHIDCEGEDCDHGEHSFNWVTEGGPMHILHGTHLGGGFLGVQLAELTPELRTHFGVAGDAGVMVSKVVDDSPAARAGIQVGDIITSLDGEAIATGRDLASTVRGKEDGEAVLMEVWRDGSVQNLTAAIEEREGKPMGYRYMTLHCDEDEEDCEASQRVRKIIKRHGGDFDHSFDCGEGDGPCEVKVQCDDTGSCECTINGEAADCEALHLGND